MPTNDLQINKSATSLFKVIANLQNSLASLLETLKPLQRTLQIRCPLCNSANQRHRLKTYDHICRQCGHIWEHEDNNFTISNTAVNKMRKTTIAILENTLANIQSQNNSKEGKVRR